MTDHPDIVERLEFLELQHELPPRVEKIIDEGVAEITRLRAEAEALRKAIDCARLFAEKVSTQPTSKPDHYTSCHQCERNQSDAEDVCAAIAATTKEQKA